MPIKCFDNNSRIKAKKELISFYVERDNQGHPLSIHNINTHTLRKLLRRKWYQSESNLPKA